jgi:hypothetical protein
MISRGKHDALRGLEVDEEETEEDEEDGDDETKAPLACITG